MDIDQISWDHYRTFLAVLDTGSLSAAARSLGLTQPTAGRHVEALERAFGGPLFLRGPQGLLPTEQARAMHAHARTMAAMSASLARIASGDMEEVRGTVRISASEVISVEALPKILCDLQERYPALEIELSAADAVEDLLNQEADIAVRMTTPRQSALLSRRIGILPMGFYAHRKYLERHGMPASIAELHSHRLIGFDRQLAYIRDILKDKPLVSDLRFQFRADSNLAQLAAIRAGVGIGVCQRALGNADPALVEVLPGILDIGLETFVVMHESLKPVPRFRAAYDALVDGLLIFAGKAANPAMTAAKEDVA